MDSFNRLYEYFIIVKSYIFVQHSWFPSLILEWVCFKLKCMWILVIFSLWPKKVKFDTKTESSSRWSIWYVSPVIEEEYVENEQVKELKVAN